MWAKHHLGRNTCYIPGTKKKKKIPNKTGTWEGPISVSPAKTRGGTDLERETGKKERSSSVDRWYERADGEREKGLCLTLGGRAITQRGEYKKTLPTGNSGKKGFM